VTKDTEKKGMGWLKGVLSNQDQFDHISAEHQASPEIVDEQPSDVEESEQTDPTNNKHLFSRDNQDKISLDLIVSLENMLKDRQLILYKNKGLEDQLHTANGTISRLKHDQMKKDQLLQEKGKEIRALEGNLTNKQMSYDQLLEDYKEYQNTSNNEYEKISNQLEKETHKYNKLNEESTNTQYQNMLKIKELEEKIRDFEIENQKYAEQNQKIVNEKAELMQTINDFTERMSFSFSPKTTDSSTSSESDE
jgi:chromosome segregation ATPase